MSPGALEIGVVSYNIHRSRALEEVAAEARRLTARPDVDVIGWQEAFRHQEVLAELGEHGWATAYVDGALLEEPGATEVPVSWRHDRFDLVSARWHRMHAGWQGRTRAWPARYLAEIRLRPTESGHGLTVLNTHLTPGLEDPARPGQLRTWRGAEAAREHLTRMRRVWRSSSDRWVVGTADLNVDLRTESAQRPAGGPTRVLGAVAATNWAALGAEAGTSTVEVPSLGRDGLLYDAVLASRAPALGRRRMRFLDHAALEGYGSDHRPVWARLRLS